ncbi:hypothetical protein EJB05_13960, partial [Eragrostis curvula]
MAPPPLQLMDELVEEVLFRLPPDNPASLVRAAIVCRQWCCLVSDAGFRRRFREFHRTPPMMDFVYYTNKTAIFVCTSSSCPPIADCGKLLPMDVRHGRVLFQHTNPEWLGEPSTNALVVWNPVMKEQWELPLLSMSHEHDGWNASVLCANYSTCDHLDCSCGPFLVVLLATLRKDIWVYIYSSVSGTWNMTATASLLVNKEIGWYWLYNSVLVENALYVKFEIYKSMLEFNLGTQGISVDYGVRWTRIFLLEGHQYLLWSRDARPDGSLVWAQSRVIDFKTLLPATAYTASHVASIADCGDIILLRAHNEVFRLDMDSGQVTMVYNVNRCLTDIFPYMSFHTPALEGTFSGLPVHQTLDKRDTMVRQGRQGKGYCKARNRNKPLSGITPP